jgi:hypothetical protein
MPYQNTLAPSPQQTSRMQGRAGEPERERYAFDLLKESMKTTPVQHWTQGAARLAQALVGGYMAGQAERERRGLGGQSSAAGVWAVLGGRAPSSARVPYTLPASFGSDENIAALKVAPTTEGTAFQFQGAADTPYGWPRFARNGAAGVNAADPDAASRHWEE